MRADVFVGAAERVSNLLDFCCEALWNHDRTQEEFLFFKDMFGPVMKEDDVWWGASESMVEKYDRFLARSIALLLCAEMARDLEEK